MQFSSITNQDELNSFLESVDWPHAFVRECHIVAPSYIDPARFVVAPDAPSCIRVLIAVHAGEDSCGVELVFERATNFALPLNSELQPNGSIWSWRIEFGFGSGKTEIEAERLHVRIVDVNACGYELRYGRDNPFGDDGWPRLEQTS